MPVLCGYCKQRAEFIENSREVYGRNYGPLYICRPCGAWVGCHRGTKTALGRLANASLRKLKMQAHAVFDPMWRNRLMARGDAYRWLAKEMGIPAAKCHIGMFSEDQCRQVIAICAKRQFQGAK